MNHVKKLLKLSIVFSVLGTMLYTYVFFRNQFPDTLRVFEGEEQLVSFSIPVSGTLYDKREREVMSFPVTDNVTIVADTDYQFRMQLKLFGVLPLRDVNVQVTPKTSLTPVGVPVGIYMKTNGAMVIGIGDFIGSDGMKYAPARYLLQEGDYILQVNGEKVTGKKDLTRRIRESEGEALQLMVERGEELIPMSLQPKADQNGVYKLGIWIRDNAQGVGTMTFIAEDGSFGALGHGINDVDTGVLMELQYGELYHTDIVGIRRGSVGTPGELTGLISYQEDNKIGEISRNTKRGIFGKLENAFIEEISEESDYLHAVPIGAKHEIKEGEATILSAVSGSVEPYSIRIDKINYYSMSEKRELELEVTDRRLLEQTGGIIQGMSGSPIIQNGKLVGAVTHVLVNDPTKGYGIFIEDMLEQNHT